MSTMTFPGLPAMTLGMLLILSALPAIAKPATHVICVMQERCENNRCLRIDDAPLFLRAIGMDEKVVFAIHGSPELIAGPAAEAGSTEALFGLKPVPDGVTTILTADEHGSHENGHFFDLLTPSRTAQSLMILGAVFHKTDEVCVSRSTLNQTRTWPTMGAEKVGFRGVCYWLHKSFNSSCTEAGED